MALCRSDPGFPTYKAMIQVAGGVGVPVPLRPDGASFDMDAMRAAVTPATRLIVLNSPANPTAGSLARPPVRLVVRASRRRRPRTLTRSFVRSFIFARSFFVFFRLFLFICALNFGRRALHHRDIRRTHDARTTRMRVVLTR